jgi:hypothetical protein
MKSEELTKAGTRTSHPLPSSGTMTRGAAGTSSSSGGTTIGEPCGTMTAGAGNYSSSGGTSSSDGTTTEVACGIGTSSSSSRTTTRGPGGNSSYSRNWRRPGGTAVVTGYDRETSSSTMCMHFALGTSSSSSLTCAMPNSSFIISNVVCKNHNIPK